MWWLIPVGIGVAKLIYDAVSEEEREARQRWENKREEVERSIEEHQRNIEINIAQARSSYDFHFLVDLHFSSMKVADAAYQLLDDARDSFAGMSKMLKESKEQRVALQAKLKKEKINNNRRAIREITEELAMVRELRKNVFADRDNVKEQKEAFLDEVRRLNNQTRELKEFIRDRCGYKGQEWYDRLEARKQVRRLSEGKGV